jgi:hypothetical protein
MDNSFSSLLCIHWVFLTVQEGNKDGERWVQDVVTCQAICFQLNVFIDKHTHSHPPPPYPTPPQLSNRYLIHISDYCILPIPSRTRSYNKMK